MMDTDITNLYGICVVQSILYQWSRMITTTVNISYPSEVNDAEERNQVDKRWI